MAGDAKPPQRERAWPSRRQVMLGLAAAAAAGSGYTWWRYSSALRAAERRLAGRSSITETRFGRLEYAISGTGPALLMLHGTGGGFDQALRFTEKLRPRGHRIIAPSRFGYLRSAFPPGPSSENQADALADLLDHLGIQRIPVAGGSAGALPAAQFALRHPDRCTGLILLVPAANLRGQDPVQMGPLQKEALRRLFGSNFYYWSTMRLMPETMIGTLLATDRALLDQVSASERQRAFTILEDMMPIEARTAGMINDGLLAGSPPQMDFSQVRVPTLVISAEDDRFGTAATARDIAAAVPDASLRIFETGGHIWLGHDDDVAEEIHRFLMELSG